MKIDTFGSPDKFPCLVVLTEKISLLDKKDRNYISKFLTDFNSNCHKVDCIGDIKFKILIYNMLQEKYINKVDNMKFYNDILSYLKNYIKSKIKFEKYYAN